jgi:predicted metal-dependent HD superfamily phosphohydrolase
MMSSFRSYPQVWVTDAMSKAGRGGVMASIMSRAQRFITEINKSELYTAL